MPTRPRAALPRAAAAEALPGLACAVLFLVLAVRDAGFQPTLWYPVGLFLLVLLTLVVATGTGVRPSAGAVVALAAFTAFTAWSFASVSWSGVRGDALEGANRTLVYLVVFALFTLMPLPRGLPAALLTLYSTGVALIGLATVARAQASHDPAAFFIDGRLASPAGYPNAAAALLVAAYWPAVTLAARRGLPPALRATLAAAATALLGTAALCQSRGSVIAFAVVCIVQLALVPGRARSVAALALTGAAVAIALPVLLDVYPVLTDESTAGPVRSALFALLAASAATGLGAWLLANLDARAGLPPATERRIGRVVLATAAVAAVGAFGWTAAAIQDPVDRVTTAWEDFTRGEEPSRSGPHLTSGLGSNRYDFWRVALGRFSEQPLTGLGVDNFAVEYVRDRRSDEEPLHPHSLEVRVLAQTGVPGAVLFALFLAAAAFAGLRARGREPIEHAALLGGLVATAYWLIHGSVDWLWEFPGLTAPAVAWLGLACNGTFAGAGRRLGVDRRVRTAAVAAGAVAAVVLTAPWLAVQHVRSAATGWIADPAAAQQRLEQARRLDPFSADADLVAGVIASRRDDVAGMRAAYGRAVDRQPSNWFAHLELALGAAEAGDGTAARAHLRRALLLNPRERLLHEVQEALERGRDVDRREIERRFLERADALAR